MMFIKPNLATFPLLKICICTMLIMIVALSTFMNQDHLERQSWNVRKGEAASSVSMRRKGSPSTLMGLSSPSIYLIVNPVLYPSRITPRLRPGTWKIQHFLDGRELLQPLSVRIRLRHPYEMTSVYINLPTYIKCLSS